MLKRSQKIPQNSGVLLSASILFRDNPRENVSIEYYEVSGSFATYKALKPPKPKRGYFGAHEESLVVEFKETADHERRNEIFDELYPKFRYLISSLLYNFRIPLFFSDEADSIEGDCMHQIFEGIDKYNPYKVSPKTGKTSKFYSYASVIVSNYLRQIIKKRKHKVRFENELCADYLLNSLDSHGNTKFSMPAEEDRIETVERQFILKDFFALLQKTLPQWQDKLTKENDKKVAAAIVKIFDDADKIESLEKKELFFLLKEITQLKPQQINGSLKNIRKLYNIFRDDYYNDKPIQ